MIETFGLTCSFAATVYAIGLFSIDHAWHRHGGITYWRLGRFGGSFYTRRPAQEQFHIPLPRR